RSDESRRNGFEIDPKLMNSHIPIQKMFIDAAKGTQEITQTRPQAFIGVRMDFKPAIAVIIACPFFCVMTHGFTDALEGVSTSIKNADTVSACSLAAS